jgi:hypothetical protein
MYIEARRRAARRSVRFIEDRFTSPQMLATLGIGLVHCAANLSRTAADPWVAQRARRLGQHAFTVWRNTRAADPASSPEAWGEWVRMYVGANALGIRSARSLRYLAAVAAAGGADACNVYPINNSGVFSNVPETCECGAENAPGVRICRSADCRRRLRHMSRLRTWCLTLTDSYCRARLGLDRDGRFARAFAAAALIRPYPLRTRHRVNDFYDAAYAVSHLVYSLNDFGRFTLRREWLPWEHAFLNGRMGTAIDLEDVDLVGEFMDALRAFHDETDRPLVNAGFRFLLDTQHDDGSWTPRSVNEDYARFHVVWAALDGIREFRWPKWGISFPTLFPYLRQAAGLVATRA